MADQSPAHALYTFLCMNTGCFDWFIEETPNGFTATFESLTLKPFRTYDECTREWSKVIVMIGKRK